MLLGALGPFTSCRRKPAALHAGLLAAELGCWESAARLAGYVRVYAGEHGMAAVQPLDQISEDRTAQILNARLPPERLAALSAETAAWDEAAVLALLRGLCASA